MVSSALGSSGVRLREGLHHSKSESKVKVLPKTSKDFTFDPNTKRDISRGNNALVSSLRPGLILNQFTWRVSLVSRPLVKN